MNEIRTRAIRTSDSLWAQVKAEASRRNRTLNDFVSDLLYAVVDDAPKRCFYCGEEAVSEITRTMTPAYRDDFDLLDALVGGGELPARHFTPVTLLAAVCESHLDSATFALMGDKGGVTSRGIVWPKIECPHPFHQGDHDGEEYTPEGQNGPWVGSGYRCPECGEGKTFARLTEQDPEETRAMGKMIGL